MRRIVAAVGLVGVLVAAAGTLSAAPAAAHAAIVRTEPANGELLDTAPEEIRLAFTEPPDLSLTTIEVVDASGASVPTGPVEQVPGGNREIRVGLQGLGDGVYTVSWQTVSRTDGHLTSSAFSFGVGVSPGEISPAGGTAQAVTPTPTALSVAAKWGLYVGLVVLFGAALAGLLALGTEVVARPWVLAAAWVLAGAGTIGFVLDERATIGVGLGTLLSSDAGGNLVRLAVSVGLTGVATLVVALRPGRATLLVLAGTAGAAFLARAAGGHAGGSAVDVAIQGLHLAGVGAWIGGLAWLVTGLRRRLEPAAVRRFSNLAAGGLALVLASGILRSTDELGAGWWLDPFESDYRTALVIKLAIVTALVALGARNRFRNVRRYDALGPRPLRRTVVAELALATAVFAMAGVLTGLPPRGTEAAEASAPPQPLVATGSDFATTTRVRLEIDPGTVGPNTFVAEIADFDTGEPVDARRVTLRFDLPERPNVASELELERGETGTWRARGTALSIAGTWTVTVLVEDGDGSVEVPLEVTPRIPEPRIEVARRPGLPDVYTIFLQEGLTIQAYVDPGVPGRTNQVHVTAFDPDGMELPLRSAVVFVDPPSGEPFRPELLRGGSGHFIANIGLETAGTWSFDVTAETRDGRVLMASFEQAFGD